MKKLALTSLPIVLFALTVAAQSSTDLNHPSTLIATPTGVNSVANKQQDDPVAKALEQAINRLAIAEEKNRLLGEQLQAKNDRISAKDEEIVALKEQRDFWKTASIERRTANNIDALRLDDAKVQLAKADAEIYRLRHPGFFASLFDKKTVYGAVGGFSACKIFGGK